MLVLVMGFDLFEVDGAVIVVVEDAVLCPRYTELADQQVRAPSSGTARTARDSSTLALLAPTPPAPAPRSARAESVPSIKYYKKVIEFRESFVEEGLFVVEGKSMRRSQDYLFASPSTAAAVLLGRSANGRIEWKDKAGRTLKEIQEAALPAEGEDE